MMKLHASLILALVVSGAGSPLSAQIKTFVAGQKARAAEVNQNFEIVKGLADTAKAAADNAQSAADAAKAAADTAQSTADTAQSAAASAVLAAAVAQTTANSALSFAKALRTRADLTGLNIVDGTLEARDIKPDIVSSIDGVTSDGGNIDLVAGSGISISSNNTTKSITIDATPFNGGTLTSQLTVNRPTGTAFEANISSPMSGSFNTGILTKVGSANRDAWARGVQGEASGRGGGGQSAVGVIGSATNATSASLAAGVFGTQGSTGTNHYGMLSSGRFASTGSKSFIHPHPKNPNKVVEFACLEGNESGTYFRGTARVSGGVAEIEIPEEWKLVTARAKLTVHLTPIRSLARLAVWEKSRDRITVRADEDCEFDYIVHGLRRGFEDHQPIKPNAGEFRPQVLGIPYGQQYSRAYRNLLVENGTLNADYTPNMQTAMKRGWVLREPTREEAALAHQGELLWQRIETEKVQEAKTGN